MKSTYFIVALTACIALNNGSYAQVSEMWASRYTGAGSNVDALNDMVVDASGNAYVVGTSYNGSGFDIVTIMYNTSGTQQWIATFNGSGNGLDEGRAIGIDGSGNVYVTGMTMSSGSNYNYITIKYDNGGNQQWTTQYDGTASGYDGAYDIAVDVNGNVVVTGESDGSGLNDYATVKYNTSGVQQWAKRYNGPGNSIDAGLAVVLDASGNVYVTGRSTGSGSNLDYATVKYNSGGTQQWVSRYNGTGNQIDEGRALAVDASGNVYVTGYSYGGNAPDYDVATVKYNSAGSYQWDMRYNGVGNDFDSGNTIAVDDASGMIYVAGRTMGSGTAQDYILIQYNTAGAEQWNQVYNGPAGNSWDEANDIVLDGSGNIYVGGTSAGIGTGNDFRTIKYDATGTLIWEIAYNGTGNNAELGVSVGINGLNQVYIAGKSRGQGTNDDYATVKYCQFTADAGLDTSVCTGDSVMLNATSGSTYSWAPASSLSSSTIQNPYAFPTSTTTYQVTVTNANGCPATDNVTVSVNPLPGPNIYAGGPTSFCQGGSVVLSTDSAATYNWSTGDNTQSILVTTTGTYSVMIVDSMGCQNSTQMTVTVWSPPSVTAAPDTAFCTGDSAQVLASGAVTYAWAADPAISDTSVANPWIVPTASGSYWVWGTNANGCVDSANVTVTLWPNPPAATITQIDSFMVSSSSTGNQWLMNGVIIPGATGQTFTATDTGYYSIVITDTNGCSTPSADTMYYAPWVGFSEYGNKAFIRIFPNPNDGEFQLDVKFDLPVSAVLSVVDISGHIYKTFILDHVSAFHKNMALSVAPGSYFIRLKTEKGSYSYPLVVR